MENKSSYLEYISSLENNIIFKRDCHYLCSKQCENTNKFLGILSISLATVILGFATYFVDRDNVSTSTQWIFAYITITQGIVLVIQMYLRSDNKSAKHYEVASKLGVLNRRIGLLLARIKGDPNEDFTEEIKEIIKDHDSIAREAITIPQRIIKRLNKEKQQMDK